jgi:hypothetical protein
MKHVSILALVAAAFALSTSAPANAVVYCKTVGVPKGCVVRPAPVAAAIYCTAPGVPVGCRARPVARGATRAAVSVGVNRGGPVNRRGVR